VSEREEVTWNHLGHLCEEEEHIWGIEYVVLQMCGVEVE
jgi:hypothetical protein